MSFFSRPLITLTSFSTGHCGAGTSTVWSSTGRWPACCGRNSSWGSLKIPTSIRPRRGASTGRPATASWRGRRRARALCCSKTGRKPCRFPARSAPSRSSARRRRRPVLGATAVPATSRSRSWKGSAPGPGNLCGCVMPGAAAGKRRRWRSSRSAGCAAPDQPVRSSLLGAAPRALRRSRPAAGRPAWLAATGPIPISPARRSLIASTHRSISTGTFLRLIRGCRKSGSAPHGRAN